MSYLIKTNLQHRRDKQIMLLLRKPCDECGAEMVLYVVQRRGSYPVYVCTKCGMIKEDENEASNRE